MRIFDARLTLLDDANATGGTMTAGGKTYPAGPGTILASEDDRIDVALLGGVLHVQRAQRIGGKKLSAAEFASEMGVVVGDGFEDGVVE